jgi:hypothetical protein
MKVLRLSFIVSLVCVTLIVGCATQNVRVEQEIQHTAYAINALNINVERDTLYIKGRLLDNKGAPVIGHMVLYCPVNPNVIDAKFAKAINVKLEGDVKGYAFTVEKSACGFIRTNIVNPSGETDSAGQFNIRVDLNSDFMKEMGNEFVLCVVSDKRLAFIGQNSYLFGSIPLGVSGPIEVSGGSISELMKSKSGSLKAITYHAGYKACAGKEWDFKGKLSFIFEGDRKNILKFEKKENK